MSATATLCPALTATPLSNSVPLVGREVIVTATRLSPGLSFGSEKPKSATVRLKAVSSVVATVASAPGEDR